MAEPKLDAAIKCFIRFVEGLSFSDDSSSYMQSSSEPFRLISRKKGTVTLSGDELEGYYAVLDGLAKAFEPDQISRKYLDKLLGDALVSAVDLAVPSKPQTSQELLRAVADEMRKRLMIKPQTHQVCFRISGVELHDEVVEFGGVKFFLFAEEHYGEYISRVRSNKADPKRSQLILDLLDKHTVQPLQGKPVAEIEVVAVDVDAARATAQRKLNFVLAIINFYSNLLNPRFNSYLSVFGCSDTGSPESIPVLTFGADLTLSHNVASVGALQRLDLAQLVANTAVDMARISQIVAKIHRNNLEERLVTAMYWAGKAATTSQDEESFLLYTIALESLLMERDNQSELSYRLRLRTAHLLGKDTAGKKCISQLMKSLYSVRSKIVHRGSYEISPSDVNRLRHLTHLAIMQVFCDSAFHRIESEQDYIRWFEDLILQ